MGISASQPLRDEHRALLPELGVLRVAADAVGSAEAVEQLELALRPVDRHLLPHMAAEDAVLYPAIDTLIASNATVGMHYDHNEIRRRVDTLKTLRRPPETDPTPPHQFQAALYGLDAVIRLHLDEEEQLYYPLLDAKLSAEQAADLIGSMHQVERDLYQQANREPLKQQ